MGIFSDILKSIIKDPILLSIWLSLLLLSGTLWTLEPSYQLSNFAKTNSTSLLKLSGFVILLAIGFLSSLLRIKFKNKINLDDYYTDKATGLSYHLDDKQKDNPICTSCLYNGKIPSPLKEMTKGWRCKLKGCEQFYENPDYKKPSKRRVISRGGGFVNNY